MATRQGTVKKTELMAYSNVRAGGVIGLTLDEGDELIARIGRERGFTFDLRCMYNDRRGEDAGDAAFHIQPILSRSVPRQWQRS